MSNAGIPAPAGFVYAVGYILVGFERTRMYPTGC